MNAVRDGEGKVHTLFYVNDVVVINECGEGIQSLVW